MEQSIQNRNQSFELQQDKIAYTQKLVLGTIIKFGPIDTRTIAKYIGRSFNSVTARVNELKKSCRIEEYDSKKNSLTHVKSTRYVIVEKSKARERAQAKYIELKEVQDSLIDDYIKDISLFTKNKIKKEIRKIDKELKILASI